MEPWIVRIVAQQRVLNGGHNAILQLNATNRASAVLKVVRTDAPSVPILELRPKVVQIHFQPAPQQHRKILLRQRIAMIYLRDRL